MATRSRQALVVRGGWPGHVPVDATELFLPGLTQAFDVEISDTLSVYETELRRFDLIVQCWSMGELTEGQCANLIGAVRSGTGFAGWHGGIMATFTPSRAYHRMVGGQFLHHPPDFLDYRVCTRADHPVTEGIGDFTVHTEQYWLITDAWNDVLATTTVQPGPKDEFTAPVEMPVVWTRKWGAGKVFCSAVGHRADDLRQPEVFALTGRGLAWAAR